MAAPVPDGWRTGAVAITGSTWCELPGAMLLVTHDDALAEAVATARWHVDDGSVRAELIVEGPR